jgi:DNA-binding XRE family transcriptional regulator
MVKRTAPDLHNRIAEYRATTGISRVDLATAVGVNPQTIGYLERGDYNPSLVLALALADHFGVRVEALFSLTPFDAANLDERVDVG